MLGAERKGQFRAIGPLHGSDTDADLPRLVMWSGKSLRIWSLHLHDKPASRRIVPKTCCGLVNRSSEWL